MATLLLDLKENLPGIRHFRVYSLIYTSVTFTFPLTLLVVEKGIFTLYFVLTLDAFCQNYLDQKKILTAFFSPSLTWININFKLEKILCYDRGEVEINRFNLTNSRKVILGPQFVWSQCRTRINSATRAVSVNFGNLFARSFVCFERSARSVCASRSYPCVNDCLPFKRGNRAPALTARQLCTSSRTWGSSRESHKFVPRNDFLFSFFLFIIPHYLFSRECGIIRLIKAPQKYRDISDDNWNCEIY